MMLERGSFVVFFFVIAGCQPSPRPPLALAQQFLHTSAGESSRSLSELSSDQIRLVLPDGTELKGRNAVSNWAAYYAELHQQLEVDCNQVRGDTAICEVVENNAWLHAAGLANRQYVVAVGLLDNSVSEAVFVEKAESAAQFQVLASRFVAWASENRKAELEALFNGEQFIYSKESAVRNLKLISAYRRAQQAD